MNHRSLLLVGLVTAAAVTRIVPHPWNVTPIGATAILAGACFPRLWQAFALVFTVMALSDLTIELRRGAALYPDIPFTYLAFAGMVTMGLLLRRNCKLFAVAAVSVVASLQFFVVSNFGVWLIGGLYPRTLDGLGQCFVKAIPFYQWQFVCDILFTLAFWALYRMAGGHAQRQLDGTAASATQLACIDQPPGR